MEVDRYENRIRSNKYILKQLLFFFLLNFNVILKHIALVYGLEDLSGYSSPIGEGALILSDFNLLKTTAVFLSYATLMYVLLRTGASAPKVQGTHGRCVMGADRANRNEPVQVLDKKLSHASQARVVSEYVYQH